MLGSPMSIPVLPSHKPLLSSTKRICRFLGFNRLDEEWQVAPLLPVASLSRSPSPLGPVLRALGCCCCRRWCWGDALGSLFCKLLRLSAPGFCCQVLRCCPLLSAPAGALSNSVMNDVFLLPWIKCTGFVKAAVTHKSFLLIPTLVAVLQMLASSEG